MTFFDPLVGYAASAGSALWSLASNPGSFLSPLPLIVATAFGAIVIVMRQRRDGDMTLRRFMKALFPARIWKHKSARHDAAIILINEGLLFFIPAVAAVAFLPLSDYIAALAGAGPSSPPNAAVLFGFGVYMAVVWDFMNTFSHYLKHKVPVLWEFHKIHHCAEVLTPLTALRRHPVETLIGAMISGLGIALAMICWALIFGAPGTTYEIGGMVVLVYFWRLLGYNLRHSHVWISYGPFWNRYLMSPAHHQLHHSREPRHHDCNFGHIFTFWDRLFGTHYLPVDGEVFEFGIEREENEKLQTLPALYGRPLKMAAERLAGARRTPALRAAE